MLRGDGDNFIIYVRKVCSEMGKWVENDAFALFLNEIIIHGIKITAQMVGFN